MDERPKNKVLRFVVTGALLGAPMVAACGGSEDQVNEPAPVEETINEPMEEPEPTPNEVAEETPEVEPPPEILPTPNTPAQPVEAQPVEAQPTEAQPTEAE